VNIYLTNQTAAEIVQILQHHQYDGTFPDQRVAIELFLNAYEQAFQENEAKVTEEHNSFLRARMASFKASKMANPHD
jgi:hypothetical protein